MPPPLPATAPSAPAAPELPEVGYERSEGAASAPLPGGYRPRAPERTALYRVVADHLESFLEDGRRRSAHGDGYPAFIERELRRYLRCGILSYGFGRFRCRACGAERFVPFSCKGRLCPSCVGRRMNDTAAQLVDSVFPPAPYRQWVLSFPWALRFPMSVNHAFLSEMLRGFLGTLFAWQRRRGRQLGIADGHPGAVTFVQRFGGALNVNPHLHSVLADGLFVRRPDDPDDDQPLLFHPLPAPTQLDIDHLATLVARRLTKVARRFLPQDGDDDDWDALPEEEQARRWLVGAALRVPGPRQLYLSDSEPREEPLRAAVDGFSLHAATCVAEHDRRALERLCRYGLRPPFAQDRLEYPAPHRVVYRLRRPWPTPAGKTSLELEPIDLLRRLAAITPAPYAHLVRYHGVFANRSRFRDRLPPPPEPDPDPDAPTPAPTQIPTLAPAPRCSPTPRPLRWPSRGRAPGPHGLSYSNGSSPSTPSSAPAAWPP